MDDEPKRPLAMSLTELNSCELDAMDHGLRQAFEADDSDVQVAVQPCRLQRRGAFRGLSRLSDQGDGRNARGVGGMGRESQTKPILRMCHCRPAYYILHCDVRY